MYLDRFPSPICIRWRKAPIYYYPDAPRFRVRNLLAFRPISAEYCRSDHAGHRVIIFRTDNCALAVCLGVEIRKGELPTACAQGVCRRDRFSFGASQPVSCTVGNIGGNRDGRIRLACRSGGFDTEKISHSEAHLKEGGAIWIGADLRDERIAAAVRLGDGDRHRAQKEGCALSISPTGEGDIDIISHLARGRRIYLPQRVPRANRC